MRKKTEIDRIRANIVKDGIANISCSISDIHDIIHPLSVKGFEFLSGDFISFLEEYRGIIPPKAPIVLKITGKDIDRDEKELIDNTIWSCLCMRMTGADKDARACIKRAVLFLLYTVLSVVLVFAIKYISEEIIVNLACVPFWFFGYRLLIYLILDCLPLWKQRNWYRQLAAMSVVFSDEKECGNQAVSADEISKVTSEYLDDADKELRSNKLAMQYIKDKGIAELGCKAENLDDLILMKRCSERKLISPLLEEYLLQVGRFLTTDCRIKFDIRGKAFSAEEQKEIQQTIKDYYAFRIVAEERGIHDNKIKIMLFTVFVIISSLILALWGKKVNVATHEFIDMLFWFFADYLLEFILISHTKFKKNKKIFEICRDMEVRFVPDQEG